MSPQRAAATSNRWLTRARHRFTDTVDLAAFSLCPLDSWSTQLHLTNNSLSRTSTSTSTINLNIEQWTALGSGGFVWGGARRLANHLHTHNAESWAGLNVIELGAGTGALGLAIAASLGANVTLTDQAAFVYPNKPSSSDDTMKDEQDALQKRSLLDLMKLNVQNNMQSTSEAEKWPGQSGTKVHEMLWGSSMLAAALPHTTYDVIVAADVLLFTSAHEDLLATLRSLSTPKTVIFVEHTDRSSSKGDKYPRDMMRFFRLLEQDTQVSWYPQIIHDYGRHITIRIDQSQQHAKNKMSPFRL